jgi:hypothetical protein
MERNVGGLDRTARGIGVVLLGFTALGAFASGRRPVALFAILGAAGLLFNYTTCFCGANAALGIDTTGDGDDRP